MTAGYELFDHTADLGIRICAASKDDLPAVAAKGLYAAVGDLAPRSEGTPDRLAFAADDEALLLRDYLARLLIELEQRLLVFENVHTALFDGGQLVVEGVWRPVDESRSVFAREVKAVTYHELSLIRTAEGFEARVIVDI